MRHIDAIRVYYGGSSDMCYIHSRHNMDQCKAGVDQGICPVGMRLCRGVILHTAVSVGAVHRLAGDTLDIGSTGSRGTESLGWSTTSTGKHQQVVIMDWMVEYSVNDLVVGMNNHCGSHVGSQVGSERCDHSGSKMLSYPQSYVGHCMVIDPKDYCRCGMVSQSGCRPGNLRSDYGT